MNRTVYLYSDRGGTAALHLIDTTALAHVTEQTPTHWAGADCVRVELTTPSPSTGERLLWGLVEAFSSPGGTLTDLHDLAAHLDIDTLAAVHAALAIAWSVDVAEVPA